ncbi:MAG: hypothetical protein COV44_00870 [Deltaproteobacteria bacterium CG11_big_fil_rev_8_21_14_0_20_45_16]|nr:MAG: hypothetical protein COV44_00870 [Deltaproteobacteria bacterium CG11_big_fil_rev_8_21_14_0_20_45_16]
MEKASIIGLPLALTSIVGCLMLEGGHLSSLVGGPAALIVLGGAFGATLVNIPFEESMRALKEAKKVFLGSHMDFEGLIEQIVRLAGIARKDGLLALEKERENITDPLLKEAMKFAVDGLDPNLVAQILDARVSHKIHLNANCAKFWKQMGAYAPTVAIVGAVLGLIHVMENLDNPDMIGPGIAVAFIATVYGVTVSNVIFLPMGGKLDIIYEHETIYFDMIMLGVRDIQMGTSPSIISSRLMALLDQEAKEEDAPA